MLTKDCGGELAQPPAQRAASGRSRKIVKRELSISETFSHKTAEGQPELTGSGSQAGGEIDRQRKDHRIEYERQKPMNKRQAPDTPAGDLHV